MPVGPFVVRYAFSTTWSRQNGSRLPCRARVIRVLPIGNNTAETLSFFQKAEASRFYSSLTPTFLNLKHLVTARHRLTTRRPQECFPL
jgi:hypothetical protein